MFDQRLGEILLEKGALSESDLERGLQEQEHRASHDYLGRILVEMGVCTEQDILEALAVQGIHIQEG